VRTRPVEAEIVVQIAVVDASVHIRREKKKELMDDGGANA